MLATRNGWHHAVVVMLVTAGAACSSPQPTAPSTPTHANVAGIWADSGGFLLWDLTQTGTAVTGVETSTAGPTIYGVDGGTITGSVSGAVFTVDEMMQRTRDSGMLHYRVQGQLTVDHGSMTGQLTYIPLFEGRTITQGVYFARLLTKP
jgi:hypothetical protein